VWLVYLAGVTATQYVTGSPWSTVPIIDPVVAESWLLRIGLVIPTTMAGLALAYVLPAWPWARRRFADDRLAAVAAAVVAAVVSHFVGTTVLKAAGVAITRPVLLGLILCTSLLWTAAARRLPDASFPPGRRGIIIGLAVAAGVLLLWDKIAVEAFSGDGMEAFALARSLDTAFFPTWDLELTATGPWAWHLAHPPVGAFIHQPAVLLLGAAEGTLRSVHVLAIAAGMAVSLCWLPRATPAVSPRLKELAVVALWLPVTVSSLFYSGLDLFSDLGKCGELLVLLGGLSSGALALRGHRSLALAVALLTCGIRWYAPMYVLIGSVAFAAAGLIRWREAAMLATAVVAVAALAAAMFLAAGHGPHIAAQFSYEHLGLLNGDPAYRTALKRTTAHLWLFSGGLLPLLIFAPWFDRAGRALSLITLGFFAFALRSTLVASHFLTPIALLPGLVALRHASEREHGARWVTGGMAITLLATFVLWPADARIVTAPRELGRHTCLVASSDHTAVTLARAVLPGLTTDTQLDVGPHVLAWYAARHDDGRCAYLATMAADSTPHVVERLVDGHRPWVDDSLPTFRLSWLRRVLTDPPDDGDDVDGR
jgi:hypothetical protein